MIFQSRHAFGMQLLATPLSSKLCQQWEKETTVLLNESAASITEEISYNMTKLGA